MLCSAVFTLLKEAFQSIYSDGDGKDTDSKWNTDGDGYEDGDGHENFAND